MDRKRRHCLRCNPISGSELQTNWPEQVVVIQEAFKVKFLHTRFKVRDLDRAIAFYTTHLGFELRSRHNSGRGSQLRHLRTPGSDTELELSLLPWDPDFQLAEDILYIAFEVDSVVETVERLRAAGVKIIEDPHGGSSGHMAFIEDPDGYEIELLDRVPA